MFTAQRCMSLTLLAKTLKYYSIAVALVFTAVLHIFTRGGREVGARGKDEVLPQPDGSIVSGGTVGVLTLGTDRAVWVRTLAGDIIVLCSWARHAEIRVEKLAQI